VNAERGGDGDVHQSRVQRRVPQGITLGCGGGHVSRGRIEPVQRLVRKRVSAPFFLKSGSQALGQASRQARLSTLVVATEEGDTRTLDPQGANELTVPMFLKAMYDQLTTFPGSVFSRVTGDVATSWKVSPDGLTYVFNLNPKIRFSGGKAITPDDVVFSLRRQKYLKGPASWFQDGVASVEQTGPSQVTIKLTSVNPDWLFLLTSPFLSIADSSVLRQHGANDATNAATTDTARAWIDEHSAGSGPFVLDRWRHGADLTMHRNPYYWGRPSPLERIVFRFEKDANTQRDLLVRGDAHIAANLTPDLAADLENSKTVGILKIPSLGFPWLGFHVNRNPALKSPKSWEACKYAIDYDGMAKIYRGGGQFLASCIPPGLPNSLPVAERFKRDIPRAKAALAAAGYPKGFTFALTYASDQLFWNIPASVIAEKVQGDLAQIGITANLRPVPSTQELTDFRAGKLEAVVHEWGADYIGWTDFLPVFAPGGHVAAPRQGWTPEFSPEAKRIADMSAEAVKTLDPAKQQQLCYQAQRLMNQVGPYVWLFEGNIQIGYRKDVIKSMATNPVWFFDVGAIELV
jgi:peptide/nickel transport system substrate-binding protein